MSFILTQFLPLKNGSFFLNVTQFWCKILLVRQCLCMGIDITQRNEAGPDRVARDDTVGRLQFYIFSLGRSGGRSPKTGSSGGVMGRRLVRNKT